MYTFIDKPIGEDIVEEEWREDYKEVNGRVIHWVIVSTSYLFSVEGISFAACRSSNEGTPDGFKYTV